MKLENNGAEKIGGLSNSSSGSSMGNSDPKNNIVGVSRPGGP